MVEFSSVLYLVRVKLKKFTVQTSGAVSTNVSIQLNPIPEHLYNLIKNKIKYIRDVKHPTQIKQEIYYIFILPSITIPLSSCLYVFFSFFFIK